jgi:hypothetical protein
MASPESDRSPTLMGLAAALGPVVVAATPLRGYRGERPGPELYVEHWWGQPLHDHGTPVLEGRLLFKHSVAVTSIPYGGHDPASVGAER